MGAPNKPATTPSLPGANSTRTDGGIADKQVIRKLTGYDPKSMETNDSFSNIEGSDPMEATSSPKAVSPSAVADASQQAVSPAQQSPLLSDMQGMPAQAQAPAVSAVPAMAQPDPTETLVRALYAVNPTEPLRRVLMQYDKELG